MLLTVTTTHRPAMDLGFLLHKNPARPQSFELTFGRAHVFYPQADDDRCTVALLLDVDPVGLVRNRRGPAGEGFALEQYVNDRPYVASSFLSVAISQVLSSALAGTGSEDKGHVDRDHLWHMRTLARLADAPDDVDGCGSRRSVVGAPDGDRRRRDGGEAAGLHYARQEGAGAAGGEVPRAGVPANHLRSGVRRAGKPA